MDKPIRNFQDCPRILAEGYSPVGVVKLLTSNSYTVYVNSFIFLAFLMLIKKKMKVLQYLSSLMCCASEVCYHFHSKCRNVHKLGQACFMGDSHMFQVHQPWESISTYHKISPVSTNAHLMVCTVHEVITFMVWY